jgi:hypothetical protein
MQPTETEKLTMKEIDDLEIQHLKEEVENKQKAEAEKSKQEEIIKRAEELIRLQNEKKES